MSDVLLLGLVALLIIESVALARVALQRRRRECGCVTCERCARWEGVAP